MISNLKPKDYCEGNREKCGLDRCPMYGTLGKANWKDGKRRIKGCNDPVARGARNRTKGDTKARKARQTLGIAGVNSRHEEVWGGPVRMEVKAGAQVGPIATRFDLAERQSEQARPLGDTRPFIMVAMPDDTKEGIVLLRLSVFRDLLAGLQE